MAYNLPPPWDAGFALPDNVKDEGLERRGFVTKWLPKGTYDNPKVGTGGYTVPKYVTASGYGQGEVVTKWLPRGTQPNVPHYLDRRPRVVNQRSISPRGVDVTFALSGTELPASYRQFGDQAAMVLLSRAAQYPRAEFKARLKATLDAIDPTLWTRAAQGAAKYQAAGERPMRALHHGLADAMSTGIAREIIAAGRSRAVPPARSLLGLGAYGQAAVGASAMGALTIASNMIASLVQQASQPQPSQTGTCPAGQTGYTWVAATSTVPAHWERTRAGQPAQFCGSMAPSGPPGGVAVSDTNVIVIGPGIELPVNANRPSQVVFPSPSTLTPEIAAWLKQMWSSGKTGANLQKPPWSVAPVAAWLQGVGIAPGEVVTGVRITGYDNPFKFKHPVNGEDWIMRVGLTNVSIAGMVMDPAQPVQLRIWIAPPPDRGILSKALSITSKVAKPAAIYGGGVISGALDIVGDLACQLVSSPNAIQTGAAVGAAAGAGPAVGAAGAAIASNFCSAPPPQEMPVAESSSILPLAIAGGVVALAAVMLTKKKKA